MWEGTTRGSLASTEMEGRSGTPRVTSACLGPPRSQLCNGFFAPRLTARCSEMQYKYVNCSLGHLRALLFPPSHFQKAQPSGAKLGLSLLCFCTTASFASSQGSHPQASRQALVSAILFQFVCGTCGHFQVPSLPYETREALSICSGSLSLA